MIKETLVVLNRLKTFPYFSYTLYFCNADYEIAKHNMNKILYAFLTVMALASCANQYNIQGTSNVSTLDGRMLYLKVLKNNELKNIDSCEVVHGQFSFNGAIDSVKMANIYMDDESVMPVVLESGSIAIKLDNTQQTISGTPLNDKLFKFMKKYDQLQNQNAELVHKHDQAIMNGQDMATVNQQLAAEAANIDQKLDDLVTSFIIDNFDNVLGPGIFMMMTSSFQYPELTPWIEDIMSKATDTFKNDPYVKEYMEAAQKIQNMQNGLAQPDMPQQPAPQPEQQGAPQEAQQAPPTPNEMAQPAEPGKE